MIVARWEITAKFGHKSEAVRLLKQWNAEVGPQVGVEPSQFRTLTGSVGAAESVIVSEVVMPSLSALDEMFEKLKTVNIHVNWGKQMAEVVVDGSNRWEVYRVLE